MIDNILTHTFPSQSKPRVVIPERLIPLLFKYYHLAPTTAHLGTKKLGPELSSIFGPQPSRTQ